MNSRRSWLGVGLYANLIAFIFVQSLLVGMVLDDSRSLHLGNWDAGALLLFVALSFVIIPICFFIILVPVNFFIPKYFEHFILLAIAVLFAIEMDHIYVKEILISHVFVRVALIIIAAAIFLGLLNKLRSHIYSLGLS